MAKKAGAADAPPIEGGEQKPQVPESVIPNEEAVAAAVETKKEGGVIPAKAVDEVVVVAFPNEVEYDEEGEPIVKEGAVKNEEPAKPNEPKVFNYKKVKESLEIDEDLDNEEKIIGVVKKLRSEGEVLKAALKANTEFESSDLYKQIVGYTNLTDEQRYRANIISQRVKDGYELEDAKDFAQEAIDEADEKLISIEGKRLKNLAISELNGHRDLITKKVEEATKLIQASSKPLADNIKEVSNILAASDTINGMKFTSQEKKAAYLKPVTDAISSGEAKKIMADPNKVAEMLTWFMQKELYDNRQRKIGRNEEVLKKMPNQPTVQSGAIPTNGQPKKDKKGFDVKGFAGQN